MSFNLKQNRYKYCFKSYSGALYCCAWSSDGRLLAAGGQDDYIMVFAEAHKNPRPLCRLKGHSSWVRQIAFDPNPPYSTAASYRSPTGIARVYQMMTGGEDGKVYPWVFNLKNLDVEITSILKKEKKKVEEDKQRQLDEKLMKEKEKLRLKMEIEADEREDGLSPEEKAAAAFKRRELQNLLEEESEMGRMKLREKERKKRDILKPGGNMLVHEAEDDVEKDEADSSSSDSNASSSDDDDDSESKSSSDENEEDEEERRRKAEEEEVELVKATDTWKPIITTMTGGDGRKHRLKIIAPVFDDERGGGPAGWEPTKAEKMKKKILDKDLLMQLHRIREAEREMERRFMEEQQKLERETERDAEGTKLEPSKTGIESTVFEMNVQPQSLSLPPAIVTKQKKTRFSVYGPVAWELYPALAPGKPITSQMHNAITGIQWERGRLAFVTSNNCVVLYFETHKQRKRREEEDY